MQQDVYDIMQRGDNRVRKGDQKLVKMFSN